MFTHYSQPRGSAMVLVMVIILLLSGFSAAMLMQSTAQSDGQTNSEQYVRSLFVTEAGISASINNLNTGGNGALGSTSALIGFGSGQYTVRATPNGANAFTLVSTSLYEGMQRSLEVVAVRTTTTVNPFQFSAFGVDSISMDSNALSDSYKSSDGTWEDQAVNRVRGLTFARNNGDIGTNGPSIVMDSNSGAIGDATAGPGGSTTNRGNSFVTGSTTPALTPQPILDVNKIMPSGYTSYINPGGVARDYNNSTRDETLPSGNYYFTRFRLDSNVNCIVRGPATIVVDTFEMCSNVKLTIDSAGGPVRIFSTGRFVMDSNTELASTTKKPADLQIWSTLDSAATTDSSKVFDINSNTKLYGTIYAPKANIIQDSNSDIYGSMVGKTIRINSNGRFHYDEDLAGISVVVPGAYELKTCREVVEPRLP